MNLKRCREQQCKTIWVLAVIPFIAVIMLGLRNWLEKRNTRVMKNHMSNFTSIPEEGTYIEARPRFFTAGKKPFPHAVLLLHGYSASAFEFDRLLPSMQDAGIPYYAPTQTGYGLNSLDLLYKIQATDWQRDAVNAYLVLAELAENISGIGHSTGANLALYVASRYPVRHLILTAPNLCLANRGGKLMDFIRMPFAGTLVNWMLPVFTKPKNPLRPHRSDTLNPRSAGHRVTYPALTMQSLRAMLALQDATPLKNLNYSDLSVFYGDQDLTVDNPGGLERLRSAGHKFYSRVFMNSAHNILEDNEFEDVVHTIMDVLKKSEASYK